MTSLIKIFYVNTLNTRPYVPKYILLCLILANNFSTYAQNDFSEIRSIQLSIWNNSNLEDTIRLEALNQVINRVYVETDADSAIYYSNLQLDLATRINSWQWIGEALNNLGGANMYKGNLYEAIDFQTKSVEAFKKSNKKDRYTMSVINLSLHYSRMSNYNEAAKYAYLGLKLSEEIDWDWAVAYSCTSLGNILFNSGSIEESIIYFERSITIHEKLKNPSGVAGALALIANCYTADNQHKKALASSLQAFTLVDSLNLYHRKGPVILKVGRNYHNLEMYDSALFYYNQSKVFAIDYGSDEQKGAVQMATAETYLSLKKYNEAINCTKEALNILSESADPANFRNCYELAYLAYKGLNKPSEALEMHEKYNLYNDSLNKINEKSSLELEIQKYKFNESKAIDSLKSAEAKQLADEKILTQKAEISKSRYLIIGLITGVITLTIIIYMLFKNRKIIAMQKAAVEKNEELLLKEEIRLNQEITNKEKELSSFAINLVQRTDFLNELKRDIKKASRISNDDSKTQKLKEISVKLVNYTSIETDELLIKQKIEEHSKGFFDRLDKKYPALSTQEKKLASLLRLGLKTKEIAAILNVEFRSANMARYRLRKKLILSENEDLVQVIMNV